MTLGAGASAGECGSDEEIKAVAEEALSDAFEEIREELGISSPTDDLPAVDVEVELVAEIDLLGEIPEEAREP